MGSTVNPVFAYGLVPGGNPTGNQVPNFASPSSKSGVNPLVPNVNLAPSSSGSSTPYGIVPAGPSTPAPSFSANTGGGYSSSTNLGKPGGPAGTQFGGFLSGMSTKDISRLFTSLKSSYGDGMAHMILDFLQGGAGFNQQAVSNLLATLQPGIERGEENIMEQFSAMGDRFGSPAATGLGDFLSQVNLNEGELVTKMYEDSLNRFMDVMMGTSGQVAKTKANSPGLLDSILQGIGLAGSAAGGSSAAISALSPNADTGILDAIAAFAAA